MMRLILSIALFLFPLSIATADCQQAFKCSPLAISQTFNGNQNFVTVMSGDGSVSTQLPAAICGSNGQGCWPSFSPDGLHIMFSSANSGSATYTINIDGTNLKRISVPSNAADTTPSYSPDGSKIIYAHVTGQNPLTTSIMVSNADGSNPVQILAPVTGMLNIEPRWSVQNQIVYLHDVSNSGSLHIWVMNPDGSGNTQLMTDGIQGEPSWSPDGNTIVFGAAMPANAGNLNVYTMHKDGTGIARITNFVEPMEAGDPSFNYNGTLVAFEVDDGGNYQSSPTAPAMVYIVNSDGSNLHSTNVICADIGCHPTWSWW